MRDLMKIAALCGLSAGFGVSFPRTRYEGFGGFGFDSPYVPHGTVMRAAKPDAYVETERPISKRRKRRLRGKGAL
jgi:hypothetical protein